MTEDVPGMPSAIAVAVRLFVTSSAAITDISGTLGKTIASGDLVAIHRARLIVFLCRRRMWSNRSRTNQAAC